MAEVSHGNAESSFGQFWKANMGFFLWLILLFLGGSLLGVYYASIKYFPEIDWQDSLTYLAAMSTIGLIMLILYGLLLFVPGLIWSEFLVFDDLLRPILCKAGGKHPEKRAIFLALGIPFFVVIAALHWALTEDSARSWLATLGGTVGSVCWVVYAMCSFLPLITGRGHRKSLKSRVREKDEDWLRLLERVGFFLLSLVASGLSLAAIQALIAQRGTEGSAMLIACTVVMAATNFLVAIYFRNQRRKAVASAVAASLLLLALGNILVEAPGARLPSRVMQIFGMGIGRHVTLVLSSEGADVLALQNIPITRSTSGANSKDGEPKGMAKVEDAEILSRLGAEYFLRASGRNFSLPKTMVLSWSVVDVDPQKRGEEPQMIGLASR